MGKIIFYTILMVLFLNASQIHRSISSSPNRVNPLLATDSASGEIAGWIFNGLVKFDKDANIVADLAKDWKFEDNKTLIFNLKKGIKWHDGKPFSAKDLLFTPIIS